MRANVDHDHQPLTERVQLQLVQVKIPLPCARTMLLYQHKLTGAQAHILSSLFLFGLFFFCDGYHCNVFGAVTLVINLSVFLWLDIIVVIMRCAAVNF